MQLANIHSFETNQLAPMSQAIVAKLSKHKMLDPFFLEIQKYHPKVRKYATWCKEILHRIQKLSKNNLTRIKNLRQFIEDHKNEMSNDHQRCLQLKIDRIQEPSALFQEKLQAEVKIIEDIDESIAEPAKGCVEVVIAFTAYYLNESNSKLEVMN